MFYSIYGNIQIFRLSKYRIVFFSEFVRFVFEIYFYYTET